MSVRPSVSGTLSRIPNQKHTRCVDVRQSKSVGQVATTGFDEKKQEVALQEIFKVDIWPQIRLGKAWHTLLVGAQVLEIGTMSGGHVGPGAKKDLPALGHALLAVQRSATSTEPVALGRHAHPSLLDRALVSLHDGVQFRPVFEDGRGEAFRGALDVLIAETRGDGQVWEASV